MEWIVGVLVVWVVFQEWRFSKAARIIDGLTERLEALEPDDDGED